MIIPIIAFVLAGNFVSASNYEVSARVPAIPPDITPTIVYPTDSSSDSGEITLRGTCPVATPAVVVAIYANGTLVGSTVCSADGNYSVPVSLNYGSYQLVARIISITGDYGRDSETLIFSVIPKDASQLGLTDGQVETLPSEGSLMIPLHIVPTYAYATLDANNVTSWKGSFTGGQLPYEVTIDWGDGIKDHFEVTDNSEQTFSHQYASAGVYPLLIKVVDSAGNTTQLASTTVTFALQQRLILDSSYKNTSPIVAFVQSHVVEIYVTSLSGLTFLWYLEHGRQLLPRLSSLNLFGEQKKFHAGRKHR